MYPWVFRKVIRINATHHIPGHSGKEKNLHGHHWKFIVEIGVHKIERKKTVEDIGKVKTLVKQLDNTCLNDTLSFDPTPDRIALWLTETILDKFGSHCEVSVTVEETPDSIVKHTKRFISKNDPYDS